MIDFKSEVKGTWFYFVEENPKLGGISLRMPTSAEYDDIRRLTVRVGKPDYHRGQRYETEKTNEKLSQKLSLRKFIVDWKGVQLDGQPLDCTDDNKEKMIKVQDFQLFIGDCIERLIDGNTTLEAARLKNSGTSADGDLPSPASSAEKTA